MSLLCGVFLVRKFGPPPPFTFLDLETNTYLAFSFDLKDSEPDGLTLHADNGTPHLVRPLIQSPILFPRPAL